MDDAAELVLSKLSPDDLNKLKSMSQPEVKFDQATNSVVLRDGKPARLSVTLPGNVYKVLKAQAEQCNVSIAQLARKAIERDLYIQDLVNKGFELLYQDTCGKLHRLFPSL